MKAKGKAERIMPNSRTVKRKVKELLGGKLVKWRATFRKEDPLGKLPTKVKFINCGGPDLEFELNDIEFLDNGDVKLYFGKGGECTIEGLLLRKKGKGE